MVVSLQAKASLRLLNQKLSSGELPLLEYQIENVSGEPFSICTYLAEHRLLCSFAIWGFRMKCFQPTPLRALGPMDYFTIAPGQSWKQILNLETAKSRGYHLAWSAGAAPRLSVERQHPPNFPPGTYTADSTLGEKIYVSEEEAGFSGRCASYDIAAASPPSNWLRGDLMGACDVNYT